MELKWTRKLPTQAGWWWSKFIPFGKKREAATVVLRITRNGSKKLRVGTQSLEELCRYGERLWAGPLIPPNATDIEE